MNFCEGPTVPNFLEHFVLNFTFSEDADSARFVGLASRLLLGDCREFAADESAMGEFNALLEQIIQAQSSSFCGPAIHPAA